MKKNNFHLKIVIVLVIILTAFFSLLCMPFLGSAHGPMHKTTHKHNLPISQTCVPMHSLFLNALNNLPINFIFCFIVLFIFLSLNLLLLKLNVLEFFKFYYLVKLRFSYSLKKNKYFNWYILFEKRDMLVLFSY